MRNQLLAAIALVFLAGCLNKGANPAPPDTTTHSGLPFLPEVKLPADGAGAEPNLAVLPDGTLFVAARGGRTAETDPARGNAWLWRSQDHGATWERLRGPSPTPTPAGNATIFGEDDADVATSPDGWVYFAVSKVATSPANNLLVEASPDGGATWKSTPFATSDGFTSIDRQWLVAGADGFVALVYAYYPEVGNNLQDIVGSVTGNSTMSIQAILSHDHGKTWSDPVHVIGPLHGREALHGKPVVLTTGELAVPYVDAPWNHWNDPATLRVGLSSNHGQSWTSVEVAPIRQSIGAMWATQVAVDATGHLYLVWNERFGDEIQLHLATSGDDGKSWTAPTLVVAEGLNIEPWVAARADGEVAVSWYGTVARGDPQNVTAETPWFAMAALSVDGGATWREGKGNETAVKLGPLCTGSHCGANHELLDYASVAFDADGRLHYAYARSTISGSQKVGFVHYARLTQP